VGLNDTSEAINDRSDIRNPCLIASEFGYCGNVDSAMIRNLNGDGAFIQIRHPFSVGEKVQLTFPLHYLDPPIEVTGVVAWIAADGVGVQFNTIDDRKAPVA
jgi:Tfp pilus assembly protein PilZ